MYLCIVKRLLPIDWVAGGRRNIKKGVESASCLRLLRISQIQIYRTVRQCSISIRLCIHYIIHSVGFGIAYPR